MTSILMVRRPSAFLPIAMSLAALATITVYLALHGTAPQADEGAAAHIWQLLMVCQLPVIAFLQSSGSPNHPNRPSPS